MHAYIEAIDYYLPEERVTNEKLATEYADWDAEKIISKTGIRERRIARPDECSSDLAEAAALKLIRTNGCSLDSIDYLLFCTQSPDYFLPTTACILQQRLGLPKSCGALDFNLGCSGYVYGLGLAKGLVETGQAKRLLLLTAETYSKFIHPADRSVRTIFGDAAAATLIAAEKEGPERIGPLVFGTDGSGAQNLIVPTGGMKRASVPDAKLMRDESGNYRTENNIFMNGPEIFTFTLRIVPSTVEALLAKAGLSMADIDLWVFHQANLYMLEHLRKKLKIPADKFFLHLAECGNTVSSTIPIALREAQLAGRLAPGAKVLTLGFGVGYSWAGALLTWK